MATVKNWYVDERPREMRTINRKQYLKLNSIACEGWKERLTEWFANELISQKKVSVSDREYNQMRDAATEKQHPILDEIFGEDKPEFKVNDWVIGWHCHYSTYKEYPWQIGGIEGGFVSPYRNNCHATGIENIRHATPSEIEAYKKENETIRVWVAECGPGNYVVDCRKNVLKYDPIGYTDIKIKDLKK